MEASEDFPDAPVIYYDLACCEAVLGNLDAARRWLEACKLDTGFRDNARVDPDLAALR